MLGYYQTDLAHECSKCHKINDSELLYETSLNMTKDTIRRCKNCGHRKLISSVSFTQGNGALNILMNPQTKIEQF